MATAKPLFATPITLLSTELDGLLDTASATQTTETDNSTSPHIDGLLDCEIAAAAATTGSVSVYAMEGSVTGVLSTSAKSSNMRKIGSVELNGTTAVRKQLRYDNVAPFFKIHCINNSGAALATTGNTIKLTGVNFTDA